HVTVVCDPTDYAEVADALRGGGLTDEQRLRLAAKVFAHTARYDGLVASYLSAREESAAPAPFPPYLSIEAERVLELRYGENPHQGAAFYKRSGESPSLAEARVLQGKELSYNNLLDLDAALSLVLELPHAAGG